MSTDTKGTLPVDGVLMALGRTYAARRPRRRSGAAFSRMVDEFPQSVYAADARREREEAKKG